MKPVTVSFKLFPGKDDDLIEWLKTLGVREKSSYIRLALRQFITPNYGYIAGPPVQAIPKLAKEPDKKVSADLDPAVSEEDLEARVDRW